MEAEHLDVADQVAKPPVGGQPGAVVDQARRDDAADRRRAPSDRRTTARAPPRRRRARVDLRARALATTRAKMPTSARRYGSSSRLVPRSGERAGQRLQLGRRGRIARRQRQLGAQRVDLRQVVVKRDGRLPFSRVLGHLGGDVRVAVAIAADPARDAQERRQARPGPEAVLDLRVEARNGLQERRPEVGEPVLDLVRAPSAWTGAARWSSTSGGPRGAAPSRCRRRPSRPRAASRSITARCRSSVLFRCTSVGWAVRTGSTRARSKKATILRVATCAARSRSKACAMVPSPGCARRGVQILGGVRQVMEVAERAHDVGGVRGAEPAERPLQVLQAGRVVIHPVADGRAADALDQVEHLGAGLLADRVAEQATEETDVLPQIHVGVTLAAASRFPARRRHVSAILTCRNARRWLGERATTRIDTAETNATQNTCSKLAENRPMPTRVTGPS